MFVDPQTRSDGFTTELEIRYWTPAGLAAVADGVDRDGLAFGRIKTACCTDRHWGR